MDLCQERKPPMPYFLKNVDGKVQGRSKRAALCIRGPRKSLRQGSAGRAVILYEKIRNGRKACETCAGYVRGKLNSGEMCSRNYRKFRDQVLLHQGSSLSPFLFAVIMDRLTDEVRRKPPWTMLFADDIVICEETREKVEQRLESWKYALERRGMKVSRSKTQYLCINGGNDNETVKMEDTKVPRVKEFKYLGSMVQERGGCEREVKKRVQAGWNGWRKVSGVICDRKLPARVKGKVYSSVVRPAMVYGLETATVTKKQVEEMEVAEMKMLRFAMGVTRKDKIRNKHIRDTVKVERLGMKMREGRLRWYGHVMRRDQEYVGRKMMEMELPGKRKRGRPRRRFLDGVKEDMEEVGAKETDIGDRKMWRMMIRCGHP